MKGFTLIEIIIYIGASSIVLVSLVSFSIYMENRMSEISLSLGRDQTADLIFKTYQNSLADDSGIVFECNEEGARVKFMEIFHQIGSFKSYHCLIGVNRSLSFFIGNEKYSEDFYR